MDKRERERERERELFELFNCFLSTSYYLESKVLSVYGGFCCIPWKLNRVCPRLSSEIFSRLRVFKIKTKMSLYSSVCIELESLLLFGFGLRFWGAR